MAISSNHDFTHGELDPTLFARSDLSFYNKSAQLLRDWMVLPGGSVRSRYGTKYIEELSAGSSFQLFEWRTGNYDYLIIVINNSNLIVKRLDTMSDTTLSHNFSNASVENRLVRGGQQQNRFLLCAASGEPMILTSAANGSVTIANFVFKNPPTFQYDSNYSTSVFTLDEVTVTPAGTPTASLPSLKITSMGTFSGFTQDFVGGNFSAFGDKDSDQDGSARIMQYVSATEVKVRIDVAFEAIDPAPAPPAPKGKFNGNVSFLSETAYNNTRGWPATLAFYESRLIFGGGAGVPQSLFFSAIDDYYDFLPGPNASDPINFTIASGESDSIQNIISTRSLQVFTKSGENATPVWGVESLTPTSVAVRRQTSNGSEITTPVILDNQTLYIKRGGRAVMAFTYAQGTDTYSSIDSSVMSTHLINNPVDMTAYTINNAYDSNVLILLNEDGSKVFFETLAEQNVAAWCATSTYEGDKWLNACAIEDRLFFITKRNGKYLLEELSWSFVMDAAVTYTATTTGEETHTLPDYFDGRDVTIVTDVIDPLGINQPAQGTYVGKFSVGNNSEVTFPVVSGKTYYIGFPVLPKLQTMPAHVMTPEGDTLYTKKRISKVFVNYNQSYSFTINGVRVPIDYLSTPSDPGIVLDAPVLPKSGIYAMPSLFLGWARKTYVEIEMTEPLPINILGISVELTV